jgi:hypothetical protein
VVDCFLRLGDVAAEEQRTHLQIERDRFDLARRSDLHGDETRFDSAAELAEIDEHGGLLDVRSGGVGGVLRRELLQPHEAAQRGRRTVSAAVGADRRQPDRRCDLHGDAVGLGLEQRSGLVPPRRLEQRLRAPARALGEVELVEEREVPWSLGL